MKQTLMYIGYLLLMFFTSCQEVDNTKKTPDFEKLKVAFLKENINWSNSAKNNDATYISNLYLEDAVLGIPTRPFVYGKENISKHWERTVSLVDDLGFETLTLSGSNEIVYETGLAFTTYKVQGISKIDTSKYLIVWRNIGKEQYKIAVDFFNR